MRWMVAMKPSMRRRLIITRVVKCVRPGWEDPNGTNNSDSNGTPQAPRPVDEPRTPNPGNTMSEQLGDNKRLLYNIMFSAHRNPGAVPGFSF